jgi:hypothetical protein
MVAAKGLLRSDLHIRNLAVYGGPSDQLQHRGPHGAPDREISTLTHTTPCDCDDVGAMHEITGQQLALFAEVYGSCSCKALAADHCRMGQGRAQQLVQPTVSLIGT